MHNYVIQLGVICVPMLVPASGWPKRLRWAPFILQDVRCVDESSHTSSLKIEHRSCSNKDTKKKKDASTSYVVTHIDRGPLGHSTSFQYWYAIIVSAPVVNVP